MNCYCTIITQDYIPFARTLLSSIQTYSDEKASLEVLISDVDALPTELKPSTEALPGLNFTAIGNIKTTLAEKIRNAYHSVDMDAYRWSMKPVFLSFLLEQEGFEKVIYLDSDIYFFSDGQFLFDLLDQHRMILTPHWRCADEPEVDMENFGKNFTDGIYNAGFIGARKDAQEILKFWGNCCVAVCKHDKSKGYFADQRYLELLPARFEGIGTVLHRGCNVAEWNLIDCKRELMPNGSLRIAGEYDLVFVHFTWWTIVQIIRGDDPLLLPFLQTYCNQLQTHHPQNMDLIEKAMEKYSDFVGSRKTTTLDTLRTRLRLRSRVKQFWKG